MILAFDNQNRVSIFNLNWYRFNQMDKVANRVAAGFQIAAILCWICCVIGILGGNLIYLASGILYAFSAVGLHRRRLWAARLAILMSLIFGAIESVLLLLTASGVLRESTHFYGMHLNIIGRFLGLLIHVGNVFFISFSWKYFKGAALSDYERGGTV